MQDGLFQNEKRCRYCQKIFFAAPEHQFKLGSEAHRVWFCKYSCMQRYREEQHAKRKYGKRGDVR